MENTMCIVYSLENCPNCEILKANLTQNNISYEERDMSSSDSITELRMNGVFVEEAPALQCGTTFLISREIFTDGRVKEEVVKFIKSSCETQYPNSTELLNETQYLKLTKAFEETQYLPENKFS